jgi:hypothetical protein
VVQGILSSVTARPENPPVYQQPHRPLTIGPIRGIPSTELRTPPYTTSCSHIGIMLQCPGAYHCQTDSSRFLEEAPSRKGPLGGLASRSRTSRLGLPVGGTTPIPDRECAAGQQSGLQYIGQSLPFSDEGQLPVPNCLCTLYWNASRI